MQNEPIILQNVIQQIKRWPKQINDMATLSFRHAYVYASHYKTFILNQVALKFQFKMAGIPAASSSCLLYSMIDDDKSTDMEIDASSNLCDIPL